MTENKGAYVQVNVYLNRNAKVFAFVGSAGEAADGVAVGGYNGGGYTMPHVGTHSGSGGGATHISWSYNPIQADIIDKNPDLVIDGVSYPGTKTDTLANRSPGGYVHYTHKWDNPQDVIAIAGGAGSDGLKNPDGDKRKQLFSYGGSDVACVALTAYNQTSPVAADNTKSTGYAHGAGRYGLGNGGGGGGWYGGNAIDNLCFGSGGGGTSYIRTGCSGFMIAGNDSEIANYVKPVTEGRNGYIKVSRN